MNAALTLSAGMARSWVALYTRGLPSETRDARRLEIDSDLWEQQWFASRRGDPAFGTAIEVLTRMLFGVISDITWRAQAGASTRADRRIKVNESLPMRALVLIAVGVALFVAVTGGAFIVGIGDDTDSTAQRLGLGAIWIGAGLSMLAGLLLGERNRWWGVGLVLVGTVLISVLWNWMLVITVPVGLVLAAIAFFRGRQTGGPGDTMASDNTRTTPEGRWKWLLGLIGVSAAAFLGLWAYAVSLEEWGEVRSVIFSIGGLLALTTGAGALVLLISDLVQKLSDKRLA